MGNACEIRFFCEETAIYMIIKINFSLSGYKGTREKYVKKQKKVIYNVVKRSYAVER